MKRGQAILLIINIILIVVSAFNAITHILNTYTLVLFLFFCFLFSIKYFGLEINNKYYSKDLLLNIIIVLFSYTIITYLIGLWLGFLNNPLSMNILKICNRIIPVIAIIILSELLRYILISKSKKYKTILLLTTVSFILLDLTLLTNIYDFNRNEKILEFILILMESITKNIFLSYSSYKTDYKIPIIYRLYMELPIYIIPIFPNLGDYVDTMIRFLIPVVFIYITYRELEKEKAVDLHIQNESKIKRNISVTVFSIFVVSFIAITCGWFKFYTLVVGSGSMTPNINKGDVIIVEKLSKKEIEDLKVGDVLVFKYDKKTIVHRILEINNNVFYTKGDANNEKDDYAIKTTNIVGTTKVRIRIIGWPVVWLNELVNKK